MWCWSFRQELLKQMRQTIPEVALIAKLIFDLIEKWYTEENGVFFPGVLRTLLQSCQRKFPKISFFCVFLLIFFYWCVVWSRFFLLTQRTRLGGLFRYLEHVRQANRKFSRGLWKKVSAQKMGFCQNTPTWFWVSFHPHFYDWNVFLKASRKCSVGFTSMVKVSERSA